MTKIDLLKQFLREQLGNNNPDLKDLEDLLDIYDGKYKMYEPITRQVFISKETPKITALYCTEFINTGLLNDNIVSIFDYVDNLRGISGDENLKTYPWMHHGGWCLEDDYFQNTAGYSPDGHSVRVFATRRELDNIGTVKSLDMFIAPIDFSDDICYYYDIPK